MTAAQAGSDRVANGSGIAMDSAFADNAAAPRGADAHRTLAEQLADPCVITEFRPGACATARSESFGGPNGPEPLHCVQGILRSLDRRPESVLCDPDPAAPNRAFLCDAQGLPLARITGLTPDQVNDALIGLGASGWEPGRNREYAARAGSAADLMPAPAKQSRFL